jgi:hypothetical protein
VAIGVSPAVGLGGLLTNFGICGKLRFQVAQQLRLEGAFTYFLPKEVTFWGISVEYKIWDVSANLQGILTKSDKFLLYSLAGCGIMGINAAAFDDSYSVTPFCLNAGGGFDVKLSDKLFFNTEAKGVRLFNKGEFADGWRYMVSAGLVLRF